MANVRIVDAIMGSGKTSAAINYINDNLRSKRILYITQFLPETERIKSACPDAEFQLPRNDLPQFQESKNRHFHFLLGEGKNIACSHQLFVWSSPETIALIKEQKYVIILDEVVDVFEKSSISRANLELLVASGIATKRVIDGDGEVTIFEKNPDVDIPGTGMQKVINCLSKRPVLQIREKGSRSNARIDVFERQWLLPADLFRASDEIYLLTYLFQSSPLYGFFQMHGIETEQWCVNRDTGRYQFSPDSPTVPEYVYSIKEKIHICNDEKRNAIGDRENALSKEWFLRDQKTAKKTKVNTLRNNVRWFMRDNGDVPHHVAAERMWSTYKDSMEYMKDRGFTNSSVVFNSRATNEYRNRRVLAYCVNVFAKPGIMKYFRIHNVEYDEEMYALSTMVQWIWRSAIRDGEEIWIYVPSKRMRRLLEMWLDDISSGVVTGLQRMRGGC